MRGALTIQVVLAMVQRLGKMFQQQLVAQNLNLILYRKPLPQVVFIHYSFVKAEPQPVPEIILPDNLELEPPEISLLLRSLQTD